MRPEPFRALQAAYANQELSNEQYLERAERLYERGEIDTGLYSETCDDFFLSGRIDLGTFARMTLDIHKAREHKFRGGGIPEHLVTFWYFTEAAGDETINIDDSSATIAMNNPERFPTLAKLTFTALGMRFAEYGSKLPVIRERLIPFLGVERCARDGALWTGSREELCRSFVSARR